MSFDATWLLPVHEVRRSQVKAELKKIVKAHRATLAVGEDVESDDGDTFEFSVGLVGRSLSEH